MQKGGKRPCYQLTKKGCLILASGYNAVLREKIIDRWEELENANVASMGYQVPQSFSEALMLAAKQQEEIERQEKEILCLSHKVAEMKPKADYCDSILRSPDPIVVTQIAKDYGMSPQEFNKKLHGLGVQYKVNAQWLLYAKYQGAGYTVSHTGLKKNSAGTWISTFWTQKGRLFLYGKLKEAGVLPVIEQTKGRAKPMVNNIDDLFV